MAEDIDRKLYKHYKNLADGNMKTGNPTKDDLIISDAKVHLADLIKKRRHINFEESTKEKTKEKK